MSSARVRNVCSRTTSRIVHPPASTTARTFARACLVWATTSPTATWPSAAIPTCPATITSSRPAAIMPCEYIPSGEPRLFGARGFAMSALLARQAHVVVVERQAVDPPRRRRDPAGEAGGLDGRPHERRHELSVLRRREPLAVLGVPLGLGDHTSVG